ncbi:DUF4328 domain-containing protein [Jatrophihabitans sp.]|uniref:DUF4328 domain-containing protein n=1 Tax=Jatrophihabitans sp. TaxID=1932789 RepID=UPI0030C6C9E0|nr:aromatic ring-opening dioxygenase [Jatrophihabitans sp.]
MQPRYDPYGKPLPRLVDLRPLGIAACVLLLGTALLLVNVMRTVLDRRSLVTSIIDHPGTITLSQAEASDRAVTDAGHVYLAGMVVTAVVFITWFYLARRNADVYDPAVHHRSRPWAIWGWICPIVSFWFPYQIARDTLRAADRRDEPPGLSDRHYPLLRVWWVLFIGSGLLARILTLGDPSTIDGVRDRQNNEIILLIPVIAAALLAILVVRRMTVADERKQLLLASGFPGPQPYPPPAVSAAWPPPTGPLYSDPGYPYTPPPPFAPPEFQAPAQPPAPSEWPPPPPPEWPPPA